MAEQISKKTYALLNKLPPPALKALKIFYAPFRYKKALKQAKKSYKCFGQNYSNNILLIAGLPKSGTTWVENMLLSFRGFTIVPDPNVTRWGYRNKGSHQYELSMEFFRQLNDALVLYKEHFHGSLNNVNIIKQLNLPYLIIYRDLRDASVSHVHYVKRTKWHPEYPEYSKKNIQEGLVHFGETLLPEWRNWIESWKQNRDLDRSIIVKYEDMKKNPVLVFGKILKCFDLPADNIEKIIDENRFDKMKKKSSFFRKGTTGDWINHFDEEAKSIFKKEIGEFLIEEGYETGLEW